MTKLQIAALIGFILVLISIPVSFSLVKRSQTLKSSASVTAKKQATSSATLQGLRGTGSSEIPSASPLSELQKLLEASAPATTTSPSPANLTPTPTINLAFGPILSFKTTLEGRPAGQQNAKVFVGIATGSATIKPKYTLTYTVDTKEDGSFSGLSLAGFNPGSTYTAYIKGPSQVDVSSTFVMSPTETTLNSNQPLLLLSGDLNEDNTVNATDYAIAKSLYGTNKSSSSWNERADFNLDGVINNLDIGFVLKNFGKTGSSSLWYSTPPASGSANLKGAGGGFWMWIPPLK